MHERKFKTGNVILSFNGKSVFVLNSFMETRAPEDIWLIKVRPYLFHIHIYLGGYCQPHLC